MDRNAVKYTIFLSLIETSLGSFLHALMIPFRGLFLALNQGFVLSHASFQKAKSRREGAELSQLISVSTAILKSLSPAGRRLTPMLAISMQGTLFSAAQLVGGVNRVSHVLGLYLISIWCQAQPLFFAWLMNGDSFFSAIQWALQKAGIEDLQTPLLIVGVLNVFVCIALVELSRRVSFEKMSLLQKKFERKNVLKSNAKKWPYFYIFSYILTVAFIYFVDSQHAKSIWIWLRPLGVGTLLWLLSSLVDIRQLTVWIKDYFPKIAYVLDRAWIVVFLKEEHESE